MFLWIPFFYTNNIIEKKNIIWLPYFFADLNFPHHLLTDLICLVTNHHSSLQCIMFSPMQWSLERHSTFGASPRASKSQSWPQHSRKVREESVYQEIHQLCLNTHLISCPLHPFYLFNVIYQHVMIHMIWCSKNQSDDAFKCFRCLKVLKAIPQDSNYADVPFRYYFDWA